MYKIWFFSISIALSVLLFYSCNRENYAQTDYGIAPVSEKNLLNKSLILYGQLHEGNLPATTPGVNFITSNSVLGSILTGDILTVYLPVITNADSLCKLYIRVKDANAYWEVPLNSNQQYPTVEIRIPNFIQLQPFEMEYLVESCAGQIGELITANSVDIYTIAGQAGSPRFNLIFELGYDLDLHVIDPSGEEIYFGHPNSVSGGQLDVDCICCDNPSENIFWSDGPTGSYQFWVNDYSDCVPENCADYTLYVFDNDNQVVQVQTGTLCDGNSPIYTYTR